MAVSTTEKTDAIAKTLDKSVLSIMGANSINGFEKAFMIASAVKDLKEALTPEYMKPIMYLQGNKLGFKTDKDDKGGYSEAEVKNCLVEAVLIGLQPYGNQFNIIAGSMYPTKEGFGHLLKQVPELSYEIIAALPRINAEKTSAAAIMKIKWTIGSSASQERDIEFAIKMNAYMGADAVIGKATRKARAWLYNTIMNTEIADGDITDIGHVDLSKEEKQNLYEERLKRKAEEENTPKEGSQTTIL